MNRYCAECGEVLEIGFDRCSKCGKEQPSIKNSLNSGSVDSMTPLDVIDIRDFTEKVFGEIRLIQQPSDNEVDNLNEDLFMGVANSKSLSALKKARIERSKKDAENLLKQRKIRQYLCPVLISLSNDAYDIAKTIIPILIPLMINKILPIQPEALLFASISIIIARMGTGSFCAEYNSLKLTSLKK